MLFKSAKVQKLEKWNVEDSSLNEILSKLQYTEATPNQESSIGWISPFETSEEMYLAGGGCYLFKLKIEKKTVNASLLKHEMDKEIAARVEKDETYKPTKEDKLDLKEDLTFKLLPSTPSSFSEELVYIDTVGKLVVMNTTKDKSIDMIDTILKTTFGDDFDFSHIAPSKEPCDEMRVWLEDLDLPENFRLGSACSLKSATEKGVISYKNHNLDDEKIVSYLSDGMDVKTIQMEWFDPEESEGNDEKLLFTMNETLSVSGIKFQGIYVTQKSDHLQGIDEVTQAQELDADFSIMTGSFREFFGEFLAIFE